MLLFVSTAYAQGGATDFLQGPIGSMLPFIVIFVVFYFLLIRPQQKKQKAMQALLADLKKGDKVVTNSGIHGTITKAGDAIITLEIADKVSIQIDRQQVGRLATEKTADSKSKK